ncbi:MAG TPA: nucleotidyltransferase family protein [Rhizobiaceae bacterium]|nr:nucleotidyltransferase family protein [Rhizobiaceae bacterium]
MPNDHLRYSGLPNAEQQRVFLEIVWADPIVQPALIAARDLDLPGWFIVSGVLYNAVWNALTGKPPGHGTKDIDLFYFDAGDLSYEAEDRVIEHAAPRFAHVPLPVEVRNQARVHLWYPQKFGRPCPRYENSAQSISYFASKTHAVGVRLEANDVLHLVAPFGLDHIFSFRIVPNHALDNAATHAEKGERAKRMWPEIIVESW